MLYLMHEMQEDSADATDAGAGSMGSLLTTKDVQALIKVDKSTIYRMAEAGRIPAIKVGRQWRFPEEQLNAWLGSRSGAVQEPEDAVALPREGSSGPLAPKTMQALAELLGDTTGAMVIITDMQGRPLTEVANPCGLFRAVESVPGTLDRCIEGWREFGEDVDFTPRFVPSHLGFLCARGFVRVGSELIGMVIVGGIAPDEWPPGPEAVAEVAAELGMPVEALSGHIDEVYYLDRAHMDWIASLLPRVGTLISHLADERGRLVTKLEAIASLAGPSRQRSES
jgi:excisionase family DNA binding protein